MRSRARVTTCCCCGAILCGCVGKLFHKANHEFDASGIKFVRAVASHHFNFRRQAHAQACRTRHFTTALHVRQQRSARDNLIDKPHDTHTHSRWYARHTRSTQVNLENTDPALLVVRQSQGSPDLGEEQGRIAGAARLTQAGVGAIADTEDRWWCTVEVEQNVRLTNTSMDNR